MSALYTIGFEKKPLATFIGILRTAGVDAVIDVRLRNTSQLAGYTKRNDFSFMLTEGFHIAYEHRPELAPSDQIMDFYKEVGDWGAYKRSFLALLEERKADAVGRAISSRYHAPCLLCYEKTADQCHRRLIAEFWARKFPDLEIIHL